MATTIQMGDITTLRLGYADVNGNRAFNVLHYRLDNVSITGGGLFPGEMASIVLPGLITAARLVLPNAWKEAASTKVSMVDMTATSVSPLPRSRSYTQTFTDPVEGLIVGDMLPLQDSPTLLKRTNVGNRWGLGRLFFVGVSETSQDEGILIPDWFEQVDGFCNQLELPLQYTIGVYTYTWGPVLWSKTPGPVVVEHVTAVTDVNVSDAILKTQRRRRPGKGI